MTRAPRILHLVLSLNPGGTERLVVELAARLRDRFPAAVCCLDEEGAWADEVRACGIPVTALGRRPGFRPGLGRDVARVAARNGATLIHAHQYSPFVYGALARLGRPGLRLVFTEHGRLSDAGPSPRRRRANWFLRHLAHAVFAVSEDVRRHLVAEGFRPDAVGVIYNGIEVGPLPDEPARAETRRTLGAADPACLIGTIARLDPVKDLGTLLEAIALLVARHVPVVLAIVGDGPERGRLEARATALGISERVRFLGHREEARRLLAGCDIYANSSVSEGVSLTILEAMAAGLPVVATGVGGTPEVVTGDCGRLVPARNPAALAEAIGRLADDPQARENLGLAARDRAAGRFTLDRMVAEYRKVYEALAGTADSR